MQGDSVQRLLWVAAVIDLVELTGCSQPLAADGDKALKGQLLATSDRLRATYSMRQFVRIYLSSEASACLY